MLTRYEFLLLKLVAFAWHILYAMLAHADWQFVVTDHTTSDTGFVVTDLTFDQKLDEINSILSPQPLAKPILHSTSGDSAPTPYSEVVRVLSLLPTPQVGFVDFGCGDGRWLLAAAERWPGVRVTGVEIDPARSEATRERVRESGLEGRIEVITGDATKVLVQADVGTAYLWPETLAALKPQIEKLRAFASYQHQPPVASTKNGDSWLYFRPVAQQAAVRPQAAVWGGMSYSGPQCNNPRCGMCASIRSQLAAPVAAQPMAASGHWVKRCQNGRCWMEFVPG